MLDEIKQKIEDEITRLTEELNVDLPARIKTALEHGDLRENAAYEDLVTESVRQARIETAAQTSEDWRIRMEEALHETNERCADRLRVALEAQEARALADRRGLSLHLDGARIFNAAVW